MTKQKHKLSILRNKELSNLFRVTPLHSPNGNLHFGHLTGLEFQRPLPENAKQRFADLKRQLKQKKARFMTLDAEKGVFVMHTPCPGRPCVGPTNS